MIEIKEYAITNDIPIINDEGLEFLINFIKKNNIKKILEIGSAIGYSAINMSLVNNDIYVYTVERDEVRYNEAVNNINKFGLNSRIEIVNKDAFDVNINDKFDLIFIDAAKAQNIKFFEKFKINLNGKGTIITDNINFYGLRDNIDEIKNRNLRGLVRKLNNYVEFLKTNEEFTTDFINVGDGISVSQRR